MAENNPQKNQCPLFRRYDVKTGGNIVAVHIARTSKAPKPPPAARALAASTDDANRSAKAYSGDSGRRWRDRLQQDHHHHDTMPPKPAKTPSDDFKALPEALPIQKKPAINKKGPAVTS